MLSVTISNRTHFNVAPLVEFDLERQILQDRVVNDFGPSHTPSLQSELQPGKHHPAHGWPMAAWYSCNVLTLNPFDCCERMPFTLAAAALSVVMIGIR